MNRESPQIINLVEYRKETRLQSEIPQEVGEALWRNYGKQIDVKTPSFKNGWKWEFTSKGWVGYIPLTPDFHFALLPKVPLKNVLGMLEYAYELKNFRFLQGFFDCQTLPDFYERLAEFLASKIINRGRQGFYCTYLSKTDSLSHIRGRINLREMISKPGNFKVSCHYEEQTADIEENQILAWTLWCILRSNLCTERVLLTVRQAYHLLQGLVTLQPKKSSVCVGRHYHRLNEDYHLLHTLCRFFLEQTGPSFERGDRLMSPFLVNMAQLYELFVAEWLKAHQYKPLLQDFHIKYQDKLKITDGISYRIDLVLQERKTGKAKYVIDTKYKNAGSPGDDIPQVVTYTLGKRCEEAILVYPSLEKPLDQLITIENIRIRPLTFSLEHDLEKAGEQFLEDLLKKD